MGQKDLKERIVLVYNRLRRQYLRDLKTYRLIHLDTDLYNRVLFDQTQLLALMFYID